MWRMRLDAFILALHNGIPSLSISLTITDLNVVTYFRYNQMYESAAGPVSELEDIFTSKFIVIMSKMVLLVGRVDLADHYNAFRALDETLASEVLCW
jgi:hypothetical protein